MNYTARKKFIRHQWRGKRFCVFDREAFMFDTLSLEITRIIDEEIVQEILGLFGKSSQDQEVKDV